MSILDTINSPDDLRKLEINKLTQVASELRDRMIDIVSKNGGHLASSLGAVDLAVALHYTFQTPQDKLLWDVGHQAYAHKMLTGRLKTFDTLRKYGGISGFPRIGESEYDAFSVGHASTSISAALGMAIARDLKNEKHKIVAVIGDGSLSGGLAFEGLNNLGSRSTDMIVVLNDNEMSISRNVGALSRYLTRVITDRRYNKIKNEVWELLGNLSNVGKRIRTLVQNVDESLKHFVIPGKLFEDLGLRYVGPVDGHNIAEMIEVFKFARDLTRGPILIHVLTKKGKGYQFAEEDATKYHGISSFSRATGDTIKSKTDLPTYSDVFGKTLVELAGRNEKIVAITAAMPDGTRLSYFRDAYPNRFFDVGIAESHAVTFAAGLAAQGLTPVVALYSTFLQRAYDQIMHDVALDNNHVVFCVDRAGLVGDDGPTHHGMFDLSFIRTIPGAVIMAPRDENELRSMMHAAIETIPGPVFIRYPRGYGRGVPIEEMIQPLQLYSPEQVLDGRGCAIVSVGDFYDTALDVREMLAERRMECGLVDARFVKPLDALFYEKLFTRCPHLVTMETNSLSGGFGSAVLELLAGSPDSQKTKVLRLGYPDAFVTHGGVEQIHKELGLDAASIVEKIIQFVNK